MAVKIRMKRFGRTHRPFYRICVMDSRTKRQGKTIEEIGHYDPMDLDNKRGVKIDLERVDYWVGVGAQPTEKVAILIKKLREDKFTATKAAPALTAPKAPEKPAEEAPAEGEAAAEGGEGEAAAEGGESAEG